MEEKKRKKHLESNHALPKLEEQKHLLSIIFSAITPLPLMLKNLL